MGPQQVSTIVTADGSRTLVNARGEGYKSRHGALAEARAVYLEGSGAAARLAVGRPLSVLEVGFGAGLNFLATAAAAEAGTAALDYRALELAPPQAETLAALGYAELLAPSPVPAALVAWRASFGETMASGWHEFAHGNVTLKLFVGDALGTTWGEDDTWRVDAVYHDAFSPAELPELWTEAFLSRLAARLTPGGAIVSFSVAGPVRRALAAVGLKVKKVAGPPGGKREVLVASMPVPTP